MSRPLRVFLCHASQDKPAVRKLHRYLKLRGVQPWLDELDLLPGENWEVEIPNAIVSSDVILVCLSKNSVDKEGYVQKEISFALDKALEKPEGTIFIVPVKLELCDVPKRLNRFQWVDVFRQDGYKRLMLGLQKRASGLGADVSPVLLDSKTKSVPNPEREAAAKLAREKAEREKLELESIEKAKHEAAEKAAREKAERETAEKTAREKLELESIEKAKREAAEKVAREKFEIEAAAKLARQKREREVAEKDAREKATFAAVGRVSNPTKPVAQKKLTYGFLGIGLLVLILGGFGLNSIFKNLPDATVTASPTKTATSEPLTFTSVPFTSTPQPTETPIPTPTLGIGSTQVSKKDGMTSLYVPAGEFTMGSDSSDQSDEKPQRQVTLPAFWIDQTEVTNAMYAKCVDAGNCAAPSNLDHFSNSSYANHPVVYVDWNKANAYCSWADRRLPTEAEWEKAARGTEAFTYPWGEGIDCNKANYSGCVNTTSPVKNYPNGVSPYGAYDMAGNAWEWVSSLYKPYPYDVNDGREDLSSSDDRVLRGGSWNFNDTYVRSAFRDRNDPTNTNIFFGFRCARSLP